MLKTLGNQPTICQRRDRNIIAVLAKRKGKAHIGDGVGGEAAVPRVPCEQRAVAEIFHAVLAVPADTASVSEPRNAHAVSGTVRHDVAADQVDPSDGFVVRHHRIFDVEKLGVGGYCLSRYRSFDPMSGTYRGRNGRRHCCR